MLDQPREAGPRIAFDGQLAHARRIGRPCPAVGGSPELARERSWPGEGCDRWTNGAGSRPTPFVRRNDQQTDAAAATGSFYACGLPPSPQPFEEMRLPWARSTTALLAACGAASQTGTASQREAREHEAPEHRVRECQGHAGPAGRARRIAGACSTRPTIIRDVPRPDDAIGPALLRSGSLGASQSCCRENIPGAPTIWHLHIHRRTAEWRVGRRILAAAADLDPPIGSAGRSLSPPASLSLVRRSSGVSLARFIYRARLTIFVDGRWPASHRHGAFCAILRARPAPSES